MYTQLFTNEKTEKEEEEEEEKEQCFDIIIKKDSNSLSNFSILIRL